MRKSKVGKTVKGINVIIISLDIFLSDVSKGTVFLHWSVANCGFRILIRCNFNKESLHVYDMVHVIILSFHVFYQHRFLSFVFNVFIERSFLRIRCFFFVMFCPCLLIVSYIVFFFFSPRSYALWCSCLTVEVLCPGIMYDQLSPSLWGTGMLLATCDSGHIWQWLLEVRYPARPRRAACALSDSVDEIAKRNDNHGQFVNASQTHLCFICLYLQVRKMFKDLMIN